MMSFPLTLPDYCHSLYTVSSKKMLSWSFKIIDTGTKRKPICNFLQLVISLTILEILQ